MRCVTLLAQAMNWPAEVQKEAEDTRSLRDRCVDTRDRWGNRVTDRDWLSRPSTTELVVLNG